MNKTLIMRVVGILAVLVSVGFAVFSFISTQNYVKTEATVISVEYDPSVIYDPDDTTTNDDHIVKMEYVVDGKTYSAEIHAQQGDYSVGQKTEISYDPQNPQNNAVGNMSLPILLIFCGVALVIGIIVFIKA